MRSAIYHGREDIRVEEYPEPETGPNDVKIDVSAGGICGSDLHEYAAGPISIPDDEPHPVTGETLPLPMGHEFAGRVTEVGGNVSEIAVGDKIAANPVIWCGECRYCLEGEYGLCESNGFIGLSGWGGGFSEYTTVDRRQAVPIPESVPLEYGPLVEPFSVGLYAIRNSEFSPGDSVAVFGTGPIGLTIVQLANAAGAGPIYAVEPRDFRREIAAESGADVTLDPTAESALDVINADTNGGVDLAFEVAGVEQTVSDSIAATRKGGSVTVVSIFEDSIEMNPNDLVYNRRTITGTLSFGGGPRSGEEFGKVLRMFDEGTLDPDALVTSTIGLDDIVEDGFESLLEENSEEVKILVEP